MPISIPTQTFSSILPWVKETIANSLTDRKIVSVVAVIFAGIALYFAIKQYWQESKPPTSTLLGKTPSGGDVETDEPIIGDEGVKADELGKPSFAEDEVKDLIIQLTENDFTSLKEKLECAKKIGKSLEDLDLSGSGITDEQLKDVLTACPNLKKLNLSYCKELTDAAIEHLPENLTELNLSNCYNLKDKAIEHLSKNLRSLGLSYCCGITDEAIKHLPKGLTELDLSVCNNLTDAAIENLPENLTKLDLSFCENLTDAAIEHLPKTLTELSLAECENLTDAAIEHLPKTLTELSLAGWVNLIDAAIEHLPENLTLLDLFDCKGLTDAAVKNLSKKTFLRELNLKECDNLTDGAIEDLKKALPSCSIYH